MKTIMRLIRQCRAQWQWFCLFASGDVISVFFLWLAEAEAFDVLSADLTVVWIGLFLTGVLIQDRREQKLIKEREAQFLERLHPYEKREEERDAEVQAYEEYIEAWAHEIKTPVALLTFVMDNRSEEMSPAVFRRLESIRGEVQFYVEQMLYYGRLRAVKKNYLYEHIRLMEFCRDVLSEFRVAFEEQNIRLSLETGEMEILSDEKGLQFILRQIITNAVKYADTRKEASRIKFRIDRETAALVISDNGMGVLPHDLPFIFEKGFTGETGGKRKVSTGMGLYLAKQMAEDLNIGIDAESEAGRGFEIRLQFRRNLL